MSRRRRQLPSPAPVEGCARGCMRQYYNGTLMVMMCMCVRVRVTECECDGGRTLNGDAHGTVSGRRLNDGCGGGGDGPPLGHPHSAFRVPSCGPPTGARVDVARAGQWLSRDRPHPHTTPITITNATMFAV